ncbi:MAG: helix-turn-helix domain-containing protein [Gemmatimonadota bacterium]|nr:MAG: helix-turn-helix domain-containing protein [Gemmatimonadota bacterium]
MPGFDALVEEAIALIERALDGRVTLRELAVVDPEGAPARLRTRWGDSIDLRFLPGAEAPEDEGLVREVGPTAGLPEVSVFRRGSGELRRRLRAAGRSFVDLSGAVHLDLPGLVVDRSDLEQPPRARARVGLIDPFADRSSLVCRVLLSGAASRAWGVRELAEAAGVSPSTASRVVRELATEGLVEFQREGRSSCTRVPDPRRLFERWTREYDWGRNRQLAFDAPIGDPQKFLPRLRQLLEGRRWALSLHAGASLVAPHAEWRRIHLYLQGDESMARYAARAAGWRSAEGGGLVIMLPYYSDSVWWALERHRGLPVVSALQLALDLWHYPLRGREQAEHLLETRLRPLWEGDGEGPAPGDPLLTLLRELKAGLALIYSDRLKGVYVYGSYARGERGAESDLDIVVVLDDVGHYAAEVDRTGDLISRLSLGFGVAISRVFVSERDWASGTSAFLANAREEAVPA